MFFLQFLSIIKAFLAGNPQNNFFLESSEKLCRLNVLKIYFRETTIL